MFSKPSPCSHDKKACSDYIKLLKKLKVKEQQLHVLSISKDKLRETEIIIKERKRLSPSAPAMKKFVQIKFPTEVL